MFRGEHGVQPRSGIQAVEMEMIDLAGKVALVTGATKGIGLAIAQDLARAGASVAVSARTAGDVRAAAEGLEGLGEGSVLGVPADVSDPEACRRMVEEIVDRFGRLDILINNAGLGIFKPIQEMTIEEWQLQVDVNLGGVFYCTKAALPHLLAAGDAWVINIGSLASRNSFSGGAGYNASKFGLLGMTEAMMLDLRYDGIRTSIIMPGSVDTHFFGRTPGPEGAWRIQPEDVSRSVLDLLAYPGRSLPSRVELRPTAPPKK
jgi:NAD(P)-dependent dehydrogenase (short-subunit alcohol dehydrogenase family)